MLKIDLAALAVYGLAVLPVSIYISDHLVPPHGLVTGALLDLPLAVRLVLYYVLGDLGLYWMHRLMHSRHSWRTHRWHHSPPYMYWLAGIRATVPNQVLFSLPFAFIAPLLHHAPGWVFVLIFAEGFFQNNWMHMNVTWRSRWLELVFVTPRYHHVHHSRAPEHRGANLVSRSGTGSSGRTWIPRASTRSPSASRARRRRSVSPSVSRLARSPFRWVPKSGKIRGGRIQA
jgi:sterol desaturase/sphingolipid hydroxylase (fatty acid hydroxylase superfamily)